MIFLFKKIKNRIPDKIKPANNSTKRLICPISLIFSAGILYTNLQNVTTFEVESYYAYGRRSDRAALG